MVQHYYVILLCEGERDSRGRSREHGESFCVYDEGRQHWEAARQNQCLVTYNDQKRVIIQIQARVEDGNLVKEQKF